MQNSQGDNSECMVPLTPETQRTNAWPALMEPKRSICASLYRDGAIDRPLPDDRMPTDAAARSNCLLDAVLNL